MKHTLIPLLSALLVAPKLAAAAMPHAATKTQTKTITVCDLRTERMVAPMSLDTPTPRLGWRIESSLQDVMQTAYHIIVASTAEKAAALEGDLWDAKVRTDQSQWVTYGGLALRSNTRCYWRVKVETTQGVSDWSDIAVWNVGLLNEADWSGQWIGSDEVMPWDVEDVHSQLSSRYLRTEFTLDRTTDEQPKQVRRATLYISGLGMYEAFINGQRVGNQVLAPLPTDYRKTVLYDAYDVTDLLAANNAIGVTLGNGRYYTMQQKKKPYKITNFGYPKLRANLIIEYTDGKRRTISTDTKWRLCQDGAIRSNNEYDGEIYDARKEFGTTAHGNNTAWTCAGYDDSQWVAAERVGIPDGTLRGAMTPGMKVVRTLRPAAVTATEGSNGKAGVFIVDM